MVAGLNFIAYRNFKVVRSPCCAGKNNLKSDKRNYHCRETGESQRPQVLMNDHRNET